MKRRPKVQTQDTSWLPTPEGHASSNASGFALCFSNKTSCVSVAVRPHTQHQQVLRSHELCVRLGDQYVFLDPLFFLSPACLTHSCYMISAAPLSTVSHSVGIFSAAAQPCRYFPVLLLNVTGTATEQVTDQATHVYLAEFQSREASAATKR